MACTSTMAAGESKEIQSSSALLTNNIESLDTDGLTVGTDTAVNTSGDPYYWVAIKEVSGRSKFGSYTGDGVDSRSITGVGFQPDYVMVFPDATSNSVHRMSSMTGDSTMRFDASGFSTNKIQALESDGFQVGSHSVVNSGTVVYYWAAFTDTLATASGKPRIIRWVEVDPYY